MTLSWQVAYAHATQGPYRKPLLFHTVREEHSDNYAAKITRAKQIRPHSIAIVTVLLASS